MLLIKDAAADYSASNVGRVIQLTSNRANLKGEFLFGRNFATSKINSAYVGAPDASAVGAPTYGVHKITSVDYLNYLDTLVADNLDITVAVVLAPGANNTLDGYAGNGAISVGGQFALYNLSGNISCQCSSAASSATGLAVTTTGPTTPLTDFRMIAGRISGLVNPALKVDEFMGGVRTKGASATGSATRVVDTRTLAFGTCKFAALSGVTDIAAGLIWHKLLSDAELLAAYLEARAVLVTMGIVC